MTRSTAYPAFERAGVNILFYCARGGATIEGLARVIESHIPYCRVELIDAETTSFAPSDADLLLLYRVHPSEDLEFIKTCRKTHPDAALGLVVESIGEENALYATLFDEGILRGVLPLDCDLDVWLAAVSMLINGGVFFPYLRRRPPLQAVGDRRAPPAVIPGRLTASEVSLSAKLTPREDEILRLISEGHQNKIIAARMNLSEHTVKVHVHNLIAKLRVTNRTQAAIAFLASQENAQTGVGKTAWRT